MDSIKQRVIIVSMASFLIMSCQSVTKSKDIKQYTGSDSYFSYNNADIWYEDIGEGDTLLFIHGFASSSYTWRYLKDYYSSTNRVVCLDLKGFGLSEKPLDRNYSLIDQTDLMISFIEARQLNNITLVGHSYGGAVALSTYVTANNGLKEMIDKLILIDSPAYKQRIPGYISLLRTPIVNNLTLGILPNNASSETILKELVYDDSKITQEMVETYGRYLNGAESHHALIETANTIVPDNIDILSAQYHNIPIPVLIIWGENDTVVNLSIGERLHKDINGSILSTIHQCGHIPQEEHPDKTIGIINNFIHKDVNTLY